MRLLCFCTSAYSHQLDHLATISSVLEIPFLLTDPDLYDMTKKYYPFTDVTYKAEKECSLEFLSSHYDLILISCKHWAKELSMTIEHLFKKSMRFCYCPHGNSDKGSLSPDSDLLLNQDLSLVYGNHMKEMLTKRGVLCSLRGTITTGNYRYNYYLKHKKFYDTLVEKEVFSFFKKKQKTILYAPTWQDPENSSSFFEATPLLIDQFPDNLNLLIKLHPNLERDDPARVYHLIGKYEHKDNILFLTNYPLVYPILSRIDIYLGDFSSVGYDFLAFNKPMFFFNPQKRDPLTDDGLSLFKCGQQLDLHNIVLSLHNPQTHLQSQRQQTYEHTFEQNIALKKIKNDLLNLIKTN